MPASAGEVQGEQTLINTGLPASFQPGGKEPRTIAVSNGFLPAVETAESGCPFVTVATGLETWLETRC
jgi:hypothetical protein